MKRHAFLLALCIALQACGGGFQPPIYPVPSAMSATITPKNDTVVFIGDSITARWAGQLAFLTHKNWINRGIPGQTSNLIARRYQSDVIDLHPGTVHILMGTNDVFPGWRLCNTLATDKATATTPPDVNSLKYSSDTCANVYYMLETAKRNQIKVVIGTIPPYACTDDRGCNRYVPDNTSDHYARIAQLNEWIKSFAAEEGVTVVDYHTALTNAEGLHYAPNLTPDGVHPNAAGYAVMQPLMEAALSSH